jgi:hypothetical protein
LRRGGGGRIELDSSFNWWVPEKWLRAPSPWTADIVTEVQTCLKGGRSSMIMVIV